MIVDEGFCEVCEKTTDDPIKRKAPLYGWGEEDCPSRRPLCWEHWAPDDKERVEYREFVEKRKAKLWHAHLEGAKLCGAYLEAADLRAAHLEGIDLSSGRLEGAHFCSAHLNGANLMGAHLEGADLSGAHLEGANLGSAHLNGANLMGAHLEGADLSGAHLEGAKLWAARLEGASLSYAHLERADLSEATMENADLQGITQTRYTLWVMFRDAFRGTWNRIRITRWDSVSGIDTTRTDSITRHYIRDAAFIEDLRKQHPNWAFLWRWSCFYGQSFLLWAFWCVLIAFGFACLYDWREFLTDGKETIRDFWDCLYFSIVAFTTLGFGDIYPSPGWGRFFAALEVILGYIGLGGLISILANKVARRA